MKIDIVILLLAALVPLAIGNIWYNPKIGFGNAWMKASGMTEEKAKGANMILILGLTYLFSFFVAFALCSFSIHQLSLTSLFFLQPIDDPTTEMGALYKSVMDVLGNSYRTFKHGAFHGTIAGIVIALPVISVGAMFERRGFKYIAIHAGYWIVSMALMGGIVCAYA